METTGSINKIDSIIYFDDFEDLVKYNPGDLTPDQRKYTSGSKWTPPQCKQPSFSKSR